MILSIFIMLIFCFILLCLVFYKLRVIPVFFKISGLMLMFVSVFAYVVKLSNYRSTIILDNYLYMYIMNFKLSFTAISLISNIGMVLFMIASIMFMNAYFRNKFINIFFIVGMVSFYILNSPSFDFMIYKLICEYMGTQFIDTVDIIVKFINIIFMLVYMSIPYVSFIGGYFVTKIEYKKRDILIGTLMFLLIDIFVIYFFVFSNLRNYFFLNLDLLKYPQTVDNIYSDRITITAFSFLFMLIIVMIIYFKPFGFLKRRFNDLNITENISETMIMMLHSYKNAFLSIRLYSDKENSEFLGNSDMRMEKINEISSENVDKLKNLIDTLNMDESLHIKKSIVDITQIADEAVSISKAAHIDGLRLNYQRRGIYAYADPYYIKDALVCLLNNAVEAVPSDKEAQINLDIGVSQNEVYVNVKDNGCGTGNVKDIFKAFYSMKKGSDNTGIGLMYVKKIVELHNGMVFVKSKPEVYTLFQLTFPYTKSELPKRKIEIMSLFGGKNG